MEHLDESLFGAPLAPAIQRHSLAQQVGTCLHQAQSDRNTDRFNHEIAESPYTTTLLSDVHDYLMQEDPLKNHRNMGIYKSVFTLLSDIDRESHEQPVSADLRNWYLDLIHGQMIATAETMGTHRRRPQFVEGDGQILNEYAQAHVTRLEQGEGPNDVNAMRVRQIRQQVVEFMAARIHHGITTLPPVSTSFDYAEVISCFRHVYSNACPHANDLINASQSQVRRGFLPLLAFLINYYERGNQIYRDHSSFAQRARQRSSDRHPNHRSWKLASPSWLERWLRLR